MLETQEVLEENPLMLKDAMARVFENVDPGKMENQVRQT